MFIEIIIPLVLYLIPGGEDGGYRLFINIPPEGAVTYYIYSIFGR